MFANLQTKVITLLAGTVVLLVSNIGSYLYGFANGTEYQTGKHAVVEVGRATAGMEKAIEHNGMIIADVIDDNLKEKEANEKLDKANKELAKFRDENRRLITASGGLFHDAPACPASSNLAGEAEATSASGGDGGLTRTVVLPKGSDEDLQTLIDEADVTLEKLRVLQDWVKSQGFY